MDGIYVFVVVGVGGTGGLVARDLPKLLIDTPHKMLLIDGDIVEKKNMKRQPYQEQDINSNKAFALTKKINTFYNIDCRYMSEYVTKDELYYKLTTEYKFFTPVILGCVDNDKTRMLLESCFNKIEDGYYFDSANSEYEGNVYLASKNNPIIRSKYYKLSMDKHPTEKSCQELSADNVQFMITNAKMAMCLLEQCHALLIKDFKEGVMQVGRFSQVFIG